MTLVLYSISHLGQRLVLLKARAGLDWIFREAELGQLSCLCNHSVAAAAPSSAHCCANNGEALPGATKTPVGDGDSHLQDMVQLQCAAREELNSASSARDIWCELYAQA